MADRIHLYSLHLAAFTKTPTGCTVWTVSGSASARSREEAVGIAYNEAYKAFPVTGGYYDHIAGADLISEKIINNAGYLYMATEN